MKISHILISALFGFWLSSCTQTTHIQVTRAAEIALPADLDTVLIINKTKAAKGDGNQVLNVLEGVLSGEPVMGDKYGAKSSVDNMARLVRHSERLDLSTDEIIELKLNNLMDNKPIKSSILDSLCKLYGADGVISLEKFDSDSPENSNSARVRTFWRVYYPNEQKIIDEFQLYSRATDYNFYSIVPTSYTSISKAGAMGSQLYFNRIVPHTVREGRKYFTRGSHEMKSAKKSIKHNDWEQASYFWEVETESNTDTKTMGRAAYNLALAEERKGNFDKALEWIDIAIGAGTNGAIAYKAILRQRKHEQPLIEDQMKRE